MISVRKYTILTAGMKWFLFASLTAAQTAAPVDTTEGLGTHAYQTYDGVNENINLQSGNLHLCIPLVSLPGRHGFDVSMPICYDSQYLQHYTMGTVTQPADLHSTSLQSCEPRGSRGRVDIYRY